METDDEPEFDPPKVDCCDSARATGGAYHAPGCPAAYTNALSEHVADLDDRDERKRRLGMHKPIERAG